MALDLTKRWPITSITVAGYKSLVTKQTIEVRPLTILAGANSSGKSSIIQPLLLLKQTLEAPYDPGPLLLDGPHVRFTFAEQMFSRIAETRTASSLRIGFETTREGLELGFKFDEKSRIQIRELIHRRQNGKVSELRTDLSPEEIWLLSPRRLKPSNAHKVVRDRFFLAVRPAGRGVGFFPAREMASSIEDIIHVPGLRGNPERTYKTSAFGSRFPGEFQNYIASIIRHWQAKDSEELWSLGESLEMLGLAWKVGTKSIDDTRVEIRVSRLPRAKRGSGDLVSIADVGLGVSQALPVIVALLAAKRGTLVYIEQPEIHLHPRAQHQMARILAAAAKRGVIVVAETHSSLLLSGIQTLVAQGALDPKIVKLHWFQRNQVTGATDIRSADFDRQGAYGDSPVDFDEVSLDADKEYLDSVESASGK
jgi:predicted ATPase